MENLKDKERIYNASEIAFFKKTKEAFGGLSNMAGGFPLKINGVSILTSEALYQACRFPHLPDVQQLIIKEKSPMTAKMVGKPYKNQSREDFEDVKINIMRWCLRVKLAQNFVDFSKLLISTQNKPIVEDSHKDTFWGAVREKKDENMLRGVNALGRLLMELRQQFIENPFSMKLVYVEPLKIPNFKLFGEYIGIVDEREKFIRFISKQYGLSLSFQQNQTNNGSYAYHQEEVEPVIKQISKSEKIINGKKNKKPLTTNPKSSTKKIENEPTLFGTK
ncbi:NADAR family protein [Haliscomenobacter hydrossis]|uniref:NADAR domain-containing protein n=1 Tax=Haliscomenobacter hydrossis (strain ATCC 27775 / DSM 1100 / LMG 10767 / O) TaxID=760192 RepID=F4KX90_HALH1|nr:NADAR family protein [Haliscomenobacter hydrossis]AEE48318.1 Conserved hypothetical protein CHP02464 [Haliscomenobacter hydrossis DSM 1100]